MADNLSIAERVRNWLENKPYILEGLEKDLINLSELSRVIQRELKVKNIQAIKASLRRHSEKLRKIKQRREERVLEILRESKISLEDGVSVAITDKDMAIENQAKVKLDSYYLYLTEKSQINKIRNNFKANLINTYENCTALILSSTIKIERMPGVVAFLTSLLAQQNINILEFISCYTKTIIVVERIDALRSYQILSRMIG